MIRRVSGAELPELRVAVREPGRSRQNGWIDCVLNTNIGFSTAALESYAFAKWEPVIFDAMLVAASVEFADVSCRRPSLGWPRRLSIRVPVDDPARWKAPAVRDGLLSALQFVTGDHWSINFFKRKGRPEDSAGDRFRLFPSSKAVLAYSDGLDSLAVAGLARSRLGDDVVRVRLGGNGAKNVMLIPTHADHRFRFKPITDSDAWRSRIPTCRSVIPTCRSRIPMHADHSGVSE